MVELNIREVEQPEAPKPQEQEQPKTGGVPESAQEEEGRRHKAAEAAKPRVAEDQGPKTGAAADAGAMIRDVELRLVRKLIDMALQGDFRAITYLLAHSRHVDQIKLGNVECPEDGVENLRRVLNAHSTGKIGGTEAKAAAGQLEAFVKAAIAVDAKVGLAALKRQVDYNERMLIQLMSLEKESVKGGNKRR
jgi:hypothetical protein